MNESAAQSLPEENSIADATLRGLTRRGAAELAYCSSRLGNLIDNAPHLRKFKKSTNLIGLLLDLSELAYEVGDLVHDSSARSCLSIKLERLRIYEETCPPLSRQFVDRIANGDPAALEKLSAWLFDE